MVRGKSFWWSLPQLKFGQPAATALYPLLGVERAKTACSARRPVLIIDPRYSGGIAQLVERLVRNEKARGSNPLTSTTLILNGLQGGTGSVTMPFHHQCGFVVNKFKDA
jgi:hypothetical protein